MGSGSQEHRQEQADIYPGLAAAGGATREVVLWFLPRTQRLNYVRSLREYNSSDLCKTEK